MKFKYCISMVLALMAICLSEGCVSKNLINKNSTDLIADKNCDKDFKEYTILSFQQNNEIYEVIASDKDNNRYKIITSKEVDGQEGSKIEIGKSYLLHLVSIEELLSGVESIPSFEITYHFGNTEIETDHSEGIFTILHPGAERIVLYTID